VRSISRYKFIYLLKLIRCVWMCVLILWTLVLHVLESEVRYTHWLPSKASCPTVNFAKAFLIQQLGPPLPRQFLFEPGKPLRIKSPGFIGDADFDDKVRINAFTAMQSFFMGYYYGVFLSESLVDTKSLKIRTVDGSWSFRSATLLKRMQRYVSESKNSKILGRETLLMIMSSLLFSYDVDIDWAGRGQSCVGIVERRALFDSSLVSSIVSPEDIGTFKLLDVDASGVPRDLRGLVRPGNAFGFSPYFDNSVLPRC
jgi:hypothetical protein